MANNPRLGQKRVRPREIMILGGAYISYGVGASFGTGIALLQYHGALGLWGILSQLISCVLTITLIYLVSKDCGDYGLKDMNSMFIHYCGPYLGRFFRWFTVVMLFLFTGTMFAGAAETFNTSYGIPLPVGTLIMLAAVIITVILGAKKLIDIIGNIAPIILVGMLIICVYSLIFHSDSLIEGSKLLIESCKDIRMTGSPVLSGVLEFGLVIVMTTGYLASVSGRQGTSKKELLIGNVSGEGSLFLFKIMLIFVFILNASTIIGSSVPIVLLGGKLGSVFGKIYALILELAIYTTAAGMAWQVVANVVPEKNKLYKPLCAVITLAAYGFTYLGPFSTLMMWVNTLSSYVGVVFIIALLYTRIFRHKKMQKVSDEPADTTAEA